VNRWHDHSVSGRASGVPNLGRVGVSVRPPGWSGAAGLLADAGSVLVAGPWSRTSTMHEKQEAGGQRQIRSVAKETPSQATRLTVSHEKRYNTTVRAYETQTHQVGRAFVAARCTNGAGLCAVAGGLLGAVHIDHRGAGSVSLVGVHDDRVLPAHDRALVAAGAGPVALPVRPPEVRSDPRPCGGARAGVAVVAWVSSGGFQ